MNLLSNTKLWVKKRASVVGARLLGTHANGVLVESGDFQYLVDLQDWGVGRQLRYHGEYGREELKTLEPLYSPSSNILVVGGHIGTLAIPLSRKCNFVHAIEANPNTFRLLTLNKEINACENLTLHNLAASDQEQELDFLLSRVNSGGSKIVPKHSAYQYYYDDPSTLKVKGVRLDDVLGDQQFDLIVMDIEGSECFALRGMPRLLAKSKALAVEFVPHHLKNVGDVTVEGFLEPLQIFNRLTIPSQGRTYCRAEFAKVLGEMYDRGTSEDSIIFQSSNSAQ